jgi:MraZ protein
MTMFMGEYRHNADKKGRIIIPVRFREALGESIIATKGLDGCIAIYTQSQWNVILEGLQKLPTTKKESRMYIHMLTARAALCEFDAQGRILIPKPLMEDAQIDNECVVIGVADHVEVWAKDRWDSYYASASENFEEVAEQLTEFIR